MSPSVSSPSPSSSSDSAALDEQLDELFHFLTLTDNIQVRLVAAQHVNSLNLDPSAFTEKRLLQLMQLLRDKEKVKKKTYLPLR